jgi:hypothetical protein
MRAKNRRRKPPLRAGTSGCRGSWGEESVIAVSRWRATCGMHRAWNGRKLHAFRSGTSAPCHATAPGTTLVQGESRKAGGIPWDGGRRGNSDAAVKKRIRLAKSFNSALTRLVENSPTSWARSPCESLRFLFQTEPTGTSYALGDSSGSRARDTTHSEICMAR